MSPENSSVESDHHEPPSERPSLNDLLVYLTEVRGTARARGVWTEFSFPLHDEGVPWQAVEPMVRLVQQLSTIKLFSKNEKWFIISSMTDAVAWTRFCENPQYAALLEESRRLERENGHDEVENPWRLPDATEEYRELVREMGRIATQEMSDWYAALGEPSMALMKLFKADEFNARHDAGRDELFGGPPMRNPYEGLLQ